MHGIYAIKLSAEVSAVFRSMLSVWDLLVTSLTLSIFIDNHDQLMEILIIQMKRRLILAGIMTLV